MKTSRLAIALAAAAFVAGWRCAWRVVPSGMPDEGPEDTAALRERLERLRYQAELLNLAHDAFFVRGIEDDFMTYWNAGAERLYGWKAEEALGRSSHQLLHTEFPIPMEEVERQVRETGEWVGELRHTCRDGRKVLVSSRWVLHRDANGEPAGILEINTDVTEQRAREEEIRSLNAELERRVADRTAELEQVNRYLLNALRERDELLHREQEARAQAEEAQRLRDEFLSVASHELKTPLSALQLQVQILQRLLQGEGWEGPSAELVRTAAERSIRQIKRLNRLTNDLLNVTRIESSRIDVEREEVDLLEIVRDVLYNVAGGDEVLRQQIRVDASLPVLGMWDRFGIEQVVTNLLTNAVKFGEGKPIRVSIHPEDGEAVLEVEDEGIGIAPTDRERIFERFERAVPAQNYGGFGLGLYIARRIAEAHGGSLEAGGEKDQGARFTLRLPLPHQTPAPLPDGTPSAPLAGESAPGS